MKLKKNLFNKNLKYSYTDKE